MGSVMSGRRARPRIRRHVPVRWIVAAALAVPAGAWVAGAVERAEQARGAYGVLREVPVMVHDLAPGAVVEPGDIELRALPEVAIPDAPATEPVGRAVRHPLFAGEVAVEGRLGGPGSGAASLLVPGRRGLAIPRTEQGLAVSVGDLVDVLAPGGSRDETVAAGTLRVARSAEVLAVGDVAVTVAVTVAEAPAVARAVLDGSVALALVGPAP